MMRQSEAVLMSHPEDPYPEPSHRARNPVAIEIERGFVARAYIGDHVHLHAVGYGTAIPSPALGATPRSSPTRRSASAWITDTSRARRTSTMWAENGLLSLSSLPVRPARARMQRSSAGDA